ncbi:MAG: ABC transporter ATP-binding protein [Deltaproteobacteria bacterium]|nr:ABC transporter ATP-binding protein [Deltaproteobacteria bacterium]
MIRLENISKTYDRGMIKALNGLSCQIKAGEIVALTGPSGSGKTTLLSIMGLIDTPTQGEVWLLGKPLKELKPFDKFRAIHIGFIFQLHHLMPHINTLGNVEIPMFSLERSHKKRRQKAYELLEAVGLDHKAHIYPTNLSGGERQRVAVARAFANSPRIILADEPTGNLDSETGELVLELILNQCRVRGNTVVIATHNSEIADRSDRTIRLKNGRIGTLGN